MTMLTQISCLAANVYFAVKGQTVLIAYPTAAFAAYLALTMGYTRFMTK